MAYIKAKCGFNVGTDFARAKADTPIELAPDEYARPRHIIGYIAPDPQSSLGFMRHGKRIRVHVSIDALGDFNEPQ